MESLIFNIPERLMFSIGWTIFHSLWIGALISLLLFFVLSIKKEEKASSRYNISLVSLIVFFFAVIFTFGLTYISAGNISFDSFELLKGINSQFGEINMLRNDVNTHQEYLATNLVESLESFLNNNYLAITLLWLAGLLVMGIRFCGGLALIAKLKKNSKAPETNKVDLIADKLKIKLGINKCIKIVESSSARVPMVIGAIKPYIIMPFGLLSGIPINQLEAIIAHELAHIRRNDFLINILQSLVEIILFYHPATWWISSVIRSEREICCDNIAIANSGDKLIYIKALLSIGEKCSSSSLPAVAMSGSDPGLLKRIKRITKMKRMGFNKSEKLISAIMSLVLVTGLFIITGFSSDAESEIITPGVVLVEDIYNPNSELITEISSPLLLSKKIQVQDTLLLNGTIHTSYVDKADNNEKDVEMTFKDGELTKLIIDGLTIAKSDYPEYKSLIEDTKADMAEAIEEIEEAAVEIEEAMDEIEEIDLVEIEEDMIEAIKEIEEIDFEEMELEMHEALIEIEELDVENMLEEIELSLEKIEEIDFEFELEQVMENIQDIDLSIIRENMEKAGENIRSIDIEEIRRNFEKSLEDINGFDKEKTRKEMEKTLKKLEKSLEDIKIDLRESKAKHKKEIEKHKKELEKQLIALQEKNL
ncbi:MAG: M56 family metallopeptidase [Bacteroidales bacterium]|nr:M56 family metallopeptidase [Bacteroidales bacterium]